MFGNLRTHLCGITVDGLTAGDDQIPFQLAGHRSDLTRGSQGIGTAEFAVGQQDGFVGAHGEGLAQDDLGSRDTHRDDGHFRAELVLELQGEFETAFVVRIHDGGNAFTDQGLGYRIDLDLGRIGDLLDTD